MEYKIRPTSRFRRDLKTMVSRGLDPGKLGEVLELLAKGEPLPQQYKDHGLKGEYLGCRECHIQPDWLLIYEADGDSLYLYLIRTGSHSDLFG